MKNNTKYEYLIKEDGVYITLFQKNGNKHVAIIDKDKLDDFLNYRYSWNIGFHGGGIKEYYLRATQYLGIVNGKPKYNTIMLHDFVLGFPNWKSIDHINNNSLDSRVLNLRESTISTNSRNRYSKNINNKSGYRNVCLIHGWYRIQLQVDGKNHLFPEKFKNADNAGCFAEEMRLKYYGEFAGKG